MLRCYVVVSLGSKRGGVFYIVVAHNQIKPLQRKEALSEDETSIISVYKSIWSVSRLKSLHLQRVNLKRVLIPETRRSIVSYDPSRRQSRLFRARRGHVTENGRKGPRKGRFCGSSLVGLSHPDRIWLFRCALVTRRTPTASVDIGLLAAFRLRISCGHCTMEFPCAPDNYWLLRILGFIP